MSLSVRVGDTVFIRTGAPATVNEREDATGKLHLEPDLAKVREATRHGYLNGLTPQSRKDLYEILDQIKDHEDDHATRIEDMRLKLEELDQDPRNQQLSKYLRAEMTHLMNTFDIKPREYVLSESKVR